MTQCKDFNVFLTLSSHKFLKNNIAFIVEKLGLYRLIFIMLFFNQLLDQHLKLELKFIQSHLKA